MMSVEGQGRGPGDLWRAGEGLTTIADEYGLTVDVV
jgi:hypothetical protein